MPKKQAELPGTRRDDEPATPPSIKALDDACEAYERAKGKATKAGQGVVEAKRAIDTLLGEHKLGAYEYEDLKGVLRKVFRKESIASCKVKVEKRTDADSDDGDDE